jgi:DNA-binding PadR family transcriptional regulator
MYPWTHLPPPLSTREFYILFALARQESRAYRLKGEIEKDSLGSLKISDGTIYPLLVKLHDEGLIDLADGSNRQHRRYSISEGGRIRLREELQRLNHVVKVSESAGLLENEMPTDIARLLLEVQKADD